MIPDDTADIAATRRVYDSSATFYADRIGTVVSDQIEASLDRSMLEAFVDEIGDRSRPILDAGCGPGRVARFVADCGLDVVGFDLAPGMLTIARAAHPRIPFVEGRLDAVPFADASVGGIVHWYSIIHTPPGGLGAVFAESARVLSSGASVLFAFQSGAGDRVDRPDAYESGAMLSSFRHAPNDVVNSLIEAGLDIRASVERDAELVHETTPQAFIVARASFAESAD